MTRYLPVHQALKTSYEVYEFQEQLDADFSTIHESLANTITEAAEQGLDATVTLPGPLWAIVNAFYSNGTWTSAQILWLRHHIEALANCDLDDRQIRLACQAVQDAAMGDDIDEVIGELCSGRAFNISADSATVTMPRAQWFVIWLMMIIGDRFSLSLSSMNRDKGVLDDTGH